MDSQEDGFLKKKKLLMQINSGELNKSILYYINEARTSPKDFSRHLISEDDNDEDISKLSNEKTFDRRSKVQKSMQLPWYIENTVLF